MRLYRGTWFVLLFPLYRTRTEPWCLNRGMNQTVSLAYRSTPSGQKYTKLGQPLQWDQPWVGLVFEVTANINVSASPLLQVLSLKKLKSKKERNMSNILRGREIQEKRVSILCSLTRTSINMSIRCTQEACHCSSSIDLHCRRMMSKIPWRKATD